MGETTKSTSHICQQAEGLCVRKTMFSCAGRLLHMDSEVLLWETHLWAYPEVPALELTFRNCCQILKFPHIQEVARFRFDLKKHILASTN